mgnify:FL=1
MNRIELKKFNAASQSIEAATDILHNKIFVENLSLIKNELDKVEELEYLFPSLTKVREAVGAILEATHNEPMDIEEIPQGRSPILQEMASDADAFLDKPPFLKN